jgi:hypothetical protein
LEFRRKVFCPVSHNNKGGLCSLASMRLGTVFDEESQSATESLDISVRQESKVKTVSFAGD